MNRVAFAFAICALTLSATAFANPQASPPPPAADATPTPVPNQYNDPAMSFTAPLDFLQVMFAPHDPMNFEQPTVVAAWLRNPGKPEQLNITITMENVESSLAGFEMVTENELRNQADGVFVKKRELTTLSNGMPAYWQELSMGSGFEELKRFDYVWVDGVRGVVLAIIGRYGRLDEATARKALANASGVLYPRGRI